MKPFRISTRTDAFALVPAIRNAYYVSYVSAKGKETLVYTYNVSDGTYTAIDSSHVIITANLDSFEISIDSVLVLRMAQKVFSVLDSFTDIVIPSGARINFYRKSSTTPNRLATLTATGIFSVNGLTETFLGGLTYRNFYRFRNSLAYRPQDFPIPTGFTFSNASKVCAVIGVGGLFAEQIQEGIESIS